MEMRHIYQMNNNIVSIMMEAKAFQEAITKLQNWHHHWQVKKKTFNTINVVIVNNKIEIHTQGSRK
eukprot:15350179-Ditylum_brightwellii.AAC.1